MAERLQRTRLVPQLDDDEGWRLSARARQPTLWGAAALAAVAMAVAAASTEFGSQRLSQVLWLAPEPSPPRMTSRQASFEPGADMKRISEAIRSLAADRDRLQARVSTLEHIVEDATGAIPVAVGGHPNEPNSLASPSTVMAYASGSIDTSVASPANPPPIASRTPLVPISDLSRFGAPTAANHDGAGASEETGPVGSVATKTEFGVDLGSAPSMAGLRGLWQSLKEAHEPLFDGLRPVMALREGTRPGTIELRLVAGPLANAGAAARLCANLSAAGLGCQATVFDGQRLALK
jgi:SPOR domain